MEVDFVRVPAPVPGLCDGCAHFTGSSKCNTVNGVGLSFAEGSCVDGMNGVSSTIWVKAVNQASEPTARKNDPATSKGKRRANKYEQAVLGALLDLGEGNKATLTGKEIARRTGFPLNCITPRFAPLRRKGLIKDSGVRRDKQIVWVLA